MSTYEKLLKAHRQLIGQTLDHQYQWFCMYKPEGLIDFESSNAVEVLFKPEYENVGVLDNLGIINNK